jgi:hypothetical protein
LQPAIEGAFSSNKILVECASLPEDIARPFSHDKYLPKDGSNQCLDSLVTIRRSIGLGIDVVNDTKCGMASALTKLGEDVEWLSQIANPTHVSLSLWEPYLTFHKAYDIASAPSSC